MFVENNVCRDCRYYQQNEFYLQRLRHFADWSKNSTEYNRLQEVQRGFIETFLIPDDVETPIHSYGRSV